MSGPGTKSYGLLRHWWRGMISEIARRNCCRQVVGKRREFAKLLLPGSEALWILSLAEENVHTRGLMPFVCAYE